MSEQGKDRLRESCMGCLKYIFLFLPIALLGATTNTFIATRVARTAEDSLEIINEAEENVRQLEASLDGTPQGWQALMLTAKRIYELGGLATPALLKLASSKTTEPIIRKMAIEIVRDLKDPRAIGPFTRIARDTTNPSGVRDDALYSLGHIGTDQAIDSLLAFLQSQEKLLKNAALSGIRALPMEKEKDRAYNPVVELALRSEDKGLRERAILALSAFGDRAVPLLAELLLDEDQKIRSKAVHGLAGTGSTLAVPPLVRLLSSDDQVTRTSATMALEHLGDTSAVPVLIEMLSRKGHDAYNAAYALAAIGDRRALGPLQDAIRQYSANGRDPEPFARAYESIENRSPTGIR